MQKKLNLKIKYREGFRPFAPSVLEEDYNKYFEGELKSPYMLCYDILEEKEINYLLIIQCLIIGKNFTVKDQVSNLLLMLILAQEFKQYQK